MELQSEDLGLGPVRFGVWGGGGGGGGAGFWGSGHTALGFGLQRFGICPEGFVRFVLILACRLLTRYCG